MMQILEYIAEHYGWFLSGAILILLAVIGYYAEKNNFGLGKNTGNDDNNKTKSMNDSYVHNTLDGNQHQTTLNEDNKQLEKTSDVEQISLSSEETSNDDILGIDEFDVPTTLSLETMPSSQIDIVPDVKSEVDLVESLPTLKVADEEEKEDSLLNEEKFNEFNEEFDSILPKKALIDTNLLEDIDDLELGKTQKFNLNDLSDLGDIELPKIKSFDTEEQDIWKF